MVNVVCEICGKEYQRHRSAIRAKHSFCGRVCMGVFNAREYAGKRPTVPCQVCGKSITQKKPSKRVTFCSRACQGTWHAKQATGRPKYQPKWSPQVTVVCLYCGKAREVARSHQRPFCNKRCYGDWKKEHVTGTNNPNYKGYQDYYGPNWLAQSRAARKRDGYKCRRCGVAQKKLGRALDVHHIKPFRTFGYVPDKNDAYLLANELTNLVSLCSKCHRFVEHGAPVQPYLL